MSEKSTPKGLKEVSYNDAVARSKEYFGGDELAATVWVSKYALKDSFGHIYESSPEDMHHRIAAEIERIEQKYPNPMPQEEIFALLDHFRYVIPQGGPMTGIGNNLQIASLSNCFVIGHKKPADSYGGIIRMDEEQVQIMKRRGGVGHDLSHLRPTGSPVLNSALTSTGIVPFMERYSNSTREVAQDGRRGALMLTISITVETLKRIWATEPSVLTLHSLIPSLPAVPSNTEQVLLIVLFLPSRMTLRIMAWPSMLLNRSVLPS